MRVSCCYFSPLARCFSFLSDPCGCVEISGEGKYHNGEPRKASTERMALGSSTPKHSLTLLRSKLHQGEQEIKKEHGHTLACQALLGHLYFMKLVPHGPLSKEAPEAKHVNEVIKKFGSLIREVPFGAAVLKVPPLLLFCLWSSVLLACGRCVPTPACLLSVFGLVFGPVFSWPAALLVVCLWSSFLVLAGRFFSPLMCPYCAFVFQGKGNSFDDRAQTACGFSSIASK